MERLEQISVNFGNLPLTRLLYSSIVRNVFLFRQTQDRTWYFSTLLIKSQNLLLTIAWVWNKMYCHVSFFSVLQI